MTRPAGVTSRGLPYPGSSGIHADTPRALQALADAITGQLSAIGAGTVLVEQFVGNKALSASGMWIHTFATLDGVQGCIGMIGPFGGGVYRWGQVTAAFLTGAGSATPGQTYGYVKPIQPGENFNNATVSLMLFAWGNARPS